MDSKETDQLTIVNRSRTHHISKKLIISKIPYFETLLSNDSFMESKENMVKLNFDEQAFEALLTWVESGHMFIEMKNLVNLCTIMDYFKINNYWMDRLVAYFNDVFSISDLPVVIPQVTPISKCINSGTLDAFICRHFLKIKNTIVWLNYPIETIEYICKLDLMIHSEMQVFNAIMKWVNFNTNSRKNYLERLLTLVRYCDLDDKDLRAIKENDYVKTLNFKPIFCSPAGCTGDCQFDRSNQYYSVLIEELDGTDLRIKVLDRSLRQLISQVFKLDESMSLNPIEPVSVNTNEYVSDIDFDSGGKTIRIDWSQKKYRLMRYNDYRSYYCDIAKCIFKKREEKCYQIEETKYFAAYSGSSLLELNDQFVLIKQRIEPGKNSPIGKLICLTAPNDVTIANNFYDDERNYLATALNDNIYIINSNLELIQFNIKTFKTYRFKGKYRSKLDGLILTSMPGNNEVMVIDKPTRIIDCFNVKDGEWRTIGILVDEINPTNNERQPNKLLTLTSAFLRLDKISSF